MDVSEACALVNGLTTYPGWSLTAENYTHRYEATLKLTVDINGGRNSDESDAPDYPTAIVPDGPRAAFAIYVGDIVHRNELTARVLETLVEVFSHEVREFTRYESGGRWVAPFHPHRHDGIVAWSERTGRPVSSDYHYGTA